jgi:nitrogen regulatory protein P-II 1
LTVSTDAEENLSVSDAKSTVLPQGAGMKLIVAIIRPEKLDDVKAELFKEEVTGLTISRVSGHGGEKEHLETYRGRPLVFEFHEKVRLEIAVSEPFVQRTVDAIVRSARTGAVGDGKIFVQALDHVVRIRTGESDNNALTPVV